MPCSGPRSFPALRSASSARASSMAPGMTAMTLLSLGPLRSMASIRAIYAWVSASLVVVPEASIADSSGIDFSSTCMAALVAVWGALWA